MAWRLGILQLSASLEETVDGFKEELALRGYKEGAGLHYDYRNVEGAVPALQGAAEELVAAGAQLLFACSTPAAQAAVRATQSKQVPVVFAPVFDPLGAGLVKDLRRPGGQVTGVSGMVPASAKVALLRRLLPRAGTVAILYASGDPNARLETANLRQAASEAGFSPLVIEAAGEEEVEAKAEEACARAEAVIVPIGRLLEGRMKQLAEMALRHRVPLLSPNPEGVNQGALCSLYADHRELGRRAGAMAAAILEGAPAGELPVAFPEEPRLAFNQKTAEALGLTIPPELLRQVSGGVK